LFYWALFPLLALLGLVGLWLGHAMSMASLLVAAQLAYSARQALEARRFSHQRAQITRAFAGHVSPALLRRVQSGDTAVAGSWIEARGRSAAVMHIEVHLEDAEPLERLAKPFDVIRRAVQAHGGMVDRLHGCQATAVFGVPLPMDEPARAALAAARALHGDDLPRLAVGIAVGAVRTGFVELDGASPYVILGRCIDEAKELAVAAARQDAGMLVVRVSPDAVRQLSSGPLPIPFRPALDGSAYHMMLE